MGIAEILFMSVGLGMDAFAVSICKGLSMIKMKWKNAIVIALYFGIFQAMMPFIGYIIGTNFSEAVSSIDHWIAFILLSVIGINMIIETFKKEDSKEDSSISFSNMIILAIATSIDALAVGFTFAFLKVSILPAVVFIGVTTFVFSAAGVKIGSIFGANYHAKAELLGGVVLIIIALKILLEGIGAL